MVQLQSFFHTTTQRIIFFDFLKYYMLHLMVPLKNTTRPAKNKPSLGYMDGNGYGKVGMGEKN